MAQKIERELVIKGQNDSAIRAIEQVDSALNNVEQSTVKQRDLFKDNFGDASTGFGALSSAINSLSGSSGAGEVAAIIGDVAGFIEYLPALGTAIAGIGIAALPVIGIGAGVAGALTLINQAYEENRQQIEEQQQFLIERNRIQFDLNKQLRDGEFDALRQRQDDVAAQLALEEQNKAVIVAQRNDIQRQIDEAPPFDLNLNNLYNQLDALDADIEKFDNETLAPLRAEFNDIASVTFSEDFNNAAETLRELGATDLSSLKQSEVQLNAERDRAVSTLAQLEAQEAALIASAQERIELAKQDRFLSDNRASQDREISERREQEDLNRALEDQAAQHQENLESIAERGADRLEDLQQSTVNAQLDASKQIIDATKDYNKAIGEANEDYFKDAIEDQRTFNRARKDAERDYQKEIKDAQLNSDVFAFLDAQDEKKESIRDIRRDEKDAEREREQELQDAIKQAQEASDERLEQINKELAAFTEKTNKELAQTKDLTDLSIAEAEREFQEKLLKDQALRDIQNQREEEDLRLRAERLEQDRGIADARADAALAKQLEGIDTRQEAEQLALDAFLLKITDIKTAIDTIANPIQPAASPGGVQQLFDAANGMFSNTPNTAPVLPPPPTLVPPPVQQQQGFSGAQSFGGQMNGQSITVQINNPNIGGVATQDDVLALGNQIVEHIRRNNGGGLRQ